MNFLKPLAFLALCPLAASAADYKPLLRDSMPQTWQMSPAMSQTFPTDDAWWQTFNDSTLTYLIDKAAANNFNVVAAVKRIQMADKAIKEARSGYSPTINLAAGWTKSQSSGAVADPVMPSSSSSVFSLGASMNWEIDVFGRVNANVKMKKAAYNASRADYDAVMVSLCADVASTYLQLRTCQKQLQVAEAHIASQTRVVELTKARHEADLGNKLDVSQAQTVLYSTQSSLPALKAQIITLTNALAILIGEYPGNLPASINDPDNFPRHSAEVAAGVPAELLRRRPDIVEAEMNLAELAAAVGVSKKEFLPTLSLSGSIGTSAHKAGNLFGKHSLNYSVAPQLSWTLFDGLARNYRTAEAKLQYEAAVDSYNLTVMNAVQEVDNAIIDYQYTLQRIELQKKVVDQSHEALVLAVDLYKAGLTAFNNVSDGQMTWLESQNNLVALEGKALSSLVTIYQALGGGWNTFGQ